MEQLQNLTTYDVLNISCFGTYVCRSGS